MQTNDKTEVLGERLQKIVNQATWTEHQKNKAVFEVFTLLLEEATSQERLNFTTLFSRLAYSGARYQISPVLLHYSHVYRKANEQGSINNEHIQRYLALGIFVSYQLLKTIWQIDLPHEVLDPETAAFFTKDKKKSIGFKPIVEALLFEINPEKKTLHFYDDDDPSVEKVALYDVADKNEMFNQNIDSLRKTFKLPVHINLVDVDIMEDGQYLPMAFVVHPDHLIDVTSVSECFKDYGSEPFLYLISKFKPAEATAPLLIGNLVNFMLDELISQPTIQFNTLLTGMFHTNPLGFAILDDVSVKDLIRKLKEHFRNLQLAVLVEFRNFEINKDDIFLEPSFYSRDFGIQGRLDLLHQKQGKPVYDIIELKSGKTFKPNVYGINASHYIQTLLYDLMIKSTFHPKTKSFNYILYSKEGEKPLRFAPPVRAQQYEALKLRNDIIAIEKKLQHTDEDNGILQYIKPDNFLKLKGFNQNDIHNFYNIYTTLNVSDKSYFDHYCAFIAREHALSKTGEHGVMKSNGHAALWLESDDEKRDRFALLSDLEIISNQSTDEDGFISFQRPKNDHSLANLRIGDIGVLYPSDTYQPRAVLKNQIFKCTITDMSEVSVTIKLRNKQYNQSLFNQHKKWSLEQDHLDSGFNSMYKNLFLWAAAPLDYRKLVLGKNPPSTTKKQISISYDDMMTSSQKKLLDAILTARDYFLVWGPPGTGKTSIMLKNIVRNLYENTRENILLLAYTNRAVDEICEAVLSIDPGYINKFLRVGSRLSSDPKYSGHLLDQVIKQSTSRQEIIELLAEKRIYISTVSSITSKTELFQLKDFDTVIIDEASQILEPMLIGLLSKFKKFILIGDHKQLPAVVVQDGSQSKITNEELNQLGINDTRISLFERMYFQIRHHGWNHAYGILEQQGRMHESLMAFPNTFFYENKLQLLPGLNRQQQANYFPLAQDSLSKYQQRTIYIPTPEDDDLNWKTNRYEAEACVETIVDLMQLYHLNGMTISRESFGIITPYRAQISLIKQCMERNLPANVTEMITVDTVERYQGGARDIIIISFCVNKLSQMDALVSLSNEGIDRKLNVALTRAREQVILIGNKEILSSNEIYSKLIESYSADVIE